MKRILLLAGLVLILILFWSSERTDNFRFNAPAPSKRFVTVRIGSRRTYIDYPPYINSLSVGHPVAAAWVGFSRDAKRFTVLVCPGDFDHSTTIMRLEDVEASDTDRSLPPDAFAEADADLARSLRDTFEFQPDWPDAKVIGRFCTEGGPWKLRQQGGWPKNSSDVVTLPDRLRRTK